MELEGCQGGELPLPGNQREPEKTETSDCEAKAALEPETVR